MTVCHQWHLKRLYNLKGSLKAIATDSDFIIHYPRFIEPDDRPQDPCEYLNRNTINIFKKIN